MAKRLPAILLGAALLVLPSVTSAADANAPFAAGTVAERTVALEQLEATSDAPNAVMARAAWAAFAAVERFGQALHRHGFRTPTSSFVPLMRLPVPENPKPEPLTYETWREILETLVADLDAAKQKLASVPKEADIGIVIDLAALRFDLDSNGTLSEDESVLSIFQAFDRSIVHRQSGAAGAVPPPTFRFDRADAYWLEGYANFLTANARMWLAHDFSKTFDTSFTLFFPHQEPDAGIMEGSGDMTTILDFVSLLHTISWPVVEPETRNAVLSDLKQVTHLSRLNWQAIRAETDNDREWLPGPQQPGPHPLTRLEVTEEIVVAWQVALDAADDVLDGRRLVPHMRYPGKGINLKRLIEEGKDFDLVLTITGPAVLPYLETGKVVDLQEWRRLSRAFGRTGITPFALWFN